MILSHALNSYFDEREMTST